MLDGRCALVTGGTRGIGAATAKALQADGATVVVTYVRDHQAAKAFSAETDIPTYQCDHTCLDATCAFVQKAQSVHGPIDVLVNNAGIVRDAMMHKMSAECWQQVISTNLDALYGVTHHVLQGMRARGWGRIINLTSVNAFKGQAGQSNYAAAKAGIIGLTKSLALEVAQKGITVNAVAPGYIETDMMRAVPPNVLERIVASVPCQRLGKAAEVARAVAFLASPQSAYITGETLHVNGGLYMA